MLWQIIYQYKNLTTMDCSHLFSLGNYDRNPTWIRVTHKSNSFIPIYKYCHYFTLLQKLTEAVYKIIYNELRQKTCCILVSKCSSKGITHTILYVGWTLDQWKIEYISFQDWRCITLTKISINVFCINCSQMSSKYILQLLAMNFEFFFFF